MSDERSTNALRDYSDTDWQKAWGRVTHLLDVPWEASAGKVCEEIRKLREQIKEARLAGFRQFGGQVAAHAEQLRQQGEAIAFMQRIASEDARIVSTRDLLGEQIIEAQRTGEMFVDANGYGYVLLPWSLRSTRDSVPGASP